MKISHKFKVGDKVRFISKDSCNAKFFRCPIDNLEILQINGNGYNIHDNVYNEDWYVEEVELELIPETYKYEVVHTETQEQWDFVLTKIKNTVNNTSKGFISYKEESGLNINSGSQADIPWWRETYKENIKIYLFEEWLDKFGHKSEYLKQNQKEEQWIPQVGDWIYSNNLGCWDYNECKHPVKIVEIKDNKFRYDLFSNTKTNSFKKGDISGHYNLSKIVRKALPHEIPTQELSKEDLLAEAKRRFPIGCKFKPVTREGYVSDSEYPQNTIPYIYMDGKDLWIIGSMNLRHPNGTWAEIVEEPKVKGNEVMPEIIDELRHNNWDVLSTTLGSIMYSTDSYKLPHPTSVKNNKILPIKVRNSNITEPTELPKRTRIKIIKKQLLTI